LGAAQMEHGLPNVQEGKTGVRLLPFSKPKRKFRIKGFFGRPPGSAPEEGRKRRCSMCG